VLIIKNSSLLQLVIVFTVAFVSPVFSFAQGRVLHENFDGSIVQPTDCIAVTSGRDGASARVGKSLECNWDGLRSWQDSLATQEMEAFAPATSEKLISLWFRIDQDVDHVGGSKLMRIGWNTSSEMIISCQFEQGDSATLYASLNNQSPFWGNAQSICGDHQWHHLRVYTSPSLIRIWLDNSLLREWTGNFDFGSGQHGVFLMSNWSSNPGWEHDTNNHVMWDDFEVFSDTGVGGVGSMREGTMTQNTGGSSSDTTAPTVSLTAPANGSTVSGSVAVSANATDAVGVLGVQFKLDGVNLGSEDASSLYSTTWDTTTASNGSHTLTATARDAAGNTTTSSSVTVTVNNPISYQRTIQIDPEGRTSKVLAGTLNVLNTSKASIKTYPFTTNSSGQATITFDISPQVAYLKLNPTPFLSRLLSVDLNTNTTYTFPKLLVGDINQDNLINSIDYSALNTKWFTTDSTSDLNKDGLVNSIDFSYINKNWIVNGDV